MPGVTMKSLEKLKGILATQLEKFDQREPRERIIIFGALLIAVVLAGNQFLIEPIIKQKKTVVKQLAEAGSIDSGLKTQLESIPIKSNEDPDRENRQKLTALKADLSQLDGKLNEAILDLVPPKEMVGILEKIFSLNTSLKLVSLEKISSKPWPPLSEEKANSIVAEQKVFRHTVRLQFEGNYLDAVAFFRDLEALPRRFFWEGLTIELLEYPVSRITLTVTTMNLTEGWIGV
jgi:MSHA biogenesis protein MshJ